MLRCLAGTELLGDKCEPSQSQSSFPKSCDETFMHFENGTWTCSQRFHARKNNLNPRKAKKKTMIR